MGSRNLQISEVGCCKGHACDDCRGCLSGRCCKNDNPDYRLPSLGDWSGPMYGAFGRLNDDGDKIECHACGKWFHSLPKHTVFAHDLNAREYKRIFGIPFVVGLVSEKTRSNLAASGHEWFSNPNDPRCQKFRASREQNKLTPEQQSAVAHQAADYEKMRRQSLGLGPSERGWCSGHL